MTIERGQPWGTVAAAPPNLVTSSGDAELAALVGACRSEGRPVPAVFLTGGDLLRSLGGTGDAARLGGQMAILPVDVVRAVSGDQVRWFVAHMVARRTWWRGEVTAAMNAQYVGTWDVAPRSHPNDGRVDVVRAAPAMSVGQRRQARRRLVHGGHVPHPQIDVRSSATISLQFQRRLRVWLDGELWLTTDSLDLTVEPDAITVCI